MGEASAQIQYAIEQLAEAAKLIPVRDADLVALEKPGLYAIYIDSPKSLPAVFRETLILRGTSLLYVGKASKSLRKRMVEQELRHRGNGSFFRSLGAIRDYRPPCGFSHVQKP